MLRRNFRSMEVYPPIAPNTFRWFRLPTGHAPTTLPCDAVEPPTTRQIGDSPTFNRIVIGVWSVRYRKHRTLISGSSADDQSGSGQNLYERGGSDQISAVTPVIILQPTYQWRISLFSPRGGYSLYVGWYGCAAVLTPFFDILRIEHDLSHGQVSCVSRTSVLCVLLPSGHCPPLLGWAPMKSRWKCPTSVPPLKKYFSGKKKEMLYICNIYMLCFTYLTHLVEYLVTRSMYS